jgi:hypothetical protein
MSALFALILMPSDFVTLAKSLGERLTAEHQPGKDGQQNG